MDFPIRLPIDCENKCCAELTDGSLENHNIFPGKVVFTLTRKKISVESGMYLAFIWNLFLCTSPERNHRSITGWIANSCTLLDTASNRSGHGTVGSSLARSSSLLLVPSCTTNRLNHSSEYRLVYQYQKFFEFAIDQ